MSYATLLAALSVGRSNADVLQTTCELAERFDASVIGLAACRPIAVICRDYSPPAPCFEEDRKQIERQLHEAEIEFRSLLKSRQHRLDWRPHTTLSPLSVFFAQEARNADLLIVGIDRSRTAADATRDIDVAELVMHTGRPVLIIPTATPRTFDRVLVAWNDSREAQRAVVDALPFLSAARRVTVVEISSQEAMTDARRHTAEVVEWLKRHGISANARVDTPAGANAIQLNAIAEGLQCDLLVAGAYGHVRGGAWVLGGITSEVLKAGRRCALLAH